MGKPKNRKTRVNTRATVKSGATRNDLAINEKVTQTINAETSAEVNAETDSCVSHDPLYAFASLVTGHDRAESWLTQERIRRSHNQSNFASIESAHFPSLTQVKPTNDTSYDRRRSRHEGTHQSITRSSVSEDNEQSSADSLVRQQNNDLAEILPAKEYLDKLGHNIHLKGHPFLHNRRSWSENCSLLHNKVMELYESVGCWTKHPWNKDNYSEDAKAALPYPFSIPFADRPSHKSQVQGSKKPQRTCLTCINAKRGCAAGTVVEGKCIVCQGGYAMTDEAIRKGEIRYEEAYDDKGRPKGPRMGGKFCGGKQRTCYWEVPEYFINTYEVAHLFFGGRFRANKAEQAKSELTPKLVQPVLDPGSPLRTDDPKTPSGREITSVNKSPGIPVPASRLTGSSSPSCIFPSPPPENHYHSLEISIHQYPPLAFPQTQLGQNLWWSGGVQNFGVAGNPSLVSGGYHIFPPASTSAPSITLNNGYVPVIDHRLLQPNSSTQITRNTSIPDEVIDPSLLNANASAQIEGEVEHARNDFDVELEELDRLTQSDAQDLVPPLPILTTDPLSVDELLEGF